MNVEKKIHYGNELQILLRFEYMLVGFFPHLTRINNFFLNLNQLIIDNVFNYLTTIKDMLFHKYQVLLHLLPCHQ